MSLHKSKPACVTPFYCVFTEMNISHRLSWDFSVNRLKCYYVLMLRVHQVTITALPTIEYHRSLINPKLI